MQAKAHRTSGAGRAHLLPCILGAALSLGAPSVASTQSLEDARQGSAHDLLERALENLQSISIAARVNARSRAEDDALEERSFLVLRYRGGDSLHTLLGGFGSGSKLLGVRILQIDGPDPGNSRAYIHSPEIGIIPQPTPYRLVDPFLGRAILQGNSLASPAVRGLDFEIIGRTPAVIAGEPVERIRARPFRSADYDTAEFFVAPSDAAILESRYYRSGELEPSRTVETPRARMRLLSNHLLPEMMIYTEDGKKTSLELRYVELSTPPPGLFEPTRFHLQAIEDIVPAESEGP